MTTVKKINKDLAKLTKAHHSLPQQIKDLNEKINTKISNCSWFTRLCVYVRSFFQSYTVDMPDVKIESEPAKKASPGQRTVIRPNIARKAAETSLPQPKCFAPEPQKGAAKDPKRLKFAKAHILAEMAAEGRYFFTDKDLKRVEEVYSQMS